VQQNAMCAYVFRGSRQFWRTIGLDFHGRGFPNPEALLSSAFLLQHSLFSWREPDILQTAEKTVPLTPFWQTGLGVTNCQSLSSFDLIGAGYYRIVTAPPSFVSVDTLQGGSPVPHPGSIVSPHRLPHAWIDH
jgi:hypothetical protein